MRYENFFDRVDDQMQKILGANSKGYKLWHKYKEGFLTPGPNNEVVKYYNNVLHDIKNGPGPNNEFVKAVNVAGDAIGSVGKIFGQ
jgi:hypothetical protein